MELDDLKQALAALDNRFDREVAVREQALQQPRSTALRRSLRPLALGQLVQAAMGILSILIGVAAWRSDAGDFGGVFFSGLIMHVYGVAMIALAVVTRSRISRLDDAGPVVAVQRRLAELRRLNIAAGYVLGMSWWVLWIPFAIVIFRVSSGVDLYALNPAVALTMAAGGAVGFLASAGLHRWASANGWTRLAALLDNALTGASLTIAQKQLDEIARFERD